MLTVVVGSNSKMQQQQQCSSVAKEVKLWALSHTFRHVPVAHWAGTVSN